MLAQRLAYHEYVALLLESRVVVSPWGWGEWSHKDFEIVMAGCVLVKPRVDAFRMYPPLYVVSGMGLGPGRARTCTWEDVSLGGV